MGPARLTCILSTVFQQRHGPSVQNKLFVQVCCTDVTNRPTSQLSLDLAHGAANGAVHYLLCKCGCGRMTAGPYLSMENASLVQLRCIYCKEADVLPIYIQRIAIDDCRRPQNLNHAKLRKLRHLIWQWLRSWNWCLPDVHQPRQTDSRNVECTHNSRSSKT